MMCSAYRWEEAMSTADRDDEKQDILLRSTSTYPRWLLCERQRPTQLPRNTSQVHFDGNASQFSRC